MQILITKLWCSQSNQGLGNSGLLLFRLKTGTTQLLNKVWQIVHGVILAVLIMSHFVVSTDMWVQSCNVWMIANMIFSLLIFMHYNQNQTLCTEKSVPSYLGSFECNIRTFDVFPKMNHDMFKIHHFPIYVYILQILVIYEIALYTWLLYLRPFYSFYHAKACCIVLSCTILCVSFLKQHVPCAYLLLLFQILLKFERWEEKVPKFAPNFQNRFQNMMS